MIVEVLFFNTNFYFYLEGASMIRTLLLILLLLPNWIVAQDQRVTGKVSAAGQNEGLPGVNVVIKGTSKGTITNIGGEFTLDVETGSTIVFSFVGYESQEVLFTGQSTINIELKESARELGEIVVVGYTSVLKQDITGAISTVSADAVKDFSINGIDQALQGQAPGVQVTQSSGTPGGGVQVRIRGATSIGASNSPLFIVDGIPIETGGLSSRSFGGQNDNALAMINSADIESYTILSDASAKAIYGSRASNGVVVITTKRGRNQKPKISLDAQRGIINVIKKLDLLDASQLLELQREAVENAGENPDAAGLIEGVTDAINTDWQDEVLRTGILQQYHLSIRGGSENTSYYISGSFRDEEGVQINNKFQRAAITLNLDQKLSEKLSLSTNITLSRALNKRVKGDNFLDGVYSGALKSLPYYTPFDENGNLVGPGSPLYAGFPNFNPVAQAILPRFNTITFKLLGNVNATYELMEGLKLKMQASIDYNDVSEDQYESSQTAIGGFLPSVGGQGYGVFSAQTLTNFNTFATLTYERKLTDLHKVSGVLGVELFQNFATGGSVQGRLFPSDDFTYIGSAGIVDVGGSFKNPPHSILSFFGEGRYDFAERLLVTASFRTDGSSNFGKNYRFGYFPAISVGWRISREAFFRSSLVNDLKIRASYGISGNERIGPFNYLAIWNSSTYNGGSGVVPNNVPNPDIKWETTSETNLGVDAEFLDGRIQTSANVYYNKTYDILLFRPYALTTGFAGLTDNIGEMENKGIELSINSVNINRQLRWSTKINLSKNLNKVLFLADSIPLYRGYGANGIEATNVIKEGEPLGSFWGLNFLGVNPATGDAIYQDQNEDGVINNDDAMVIGNAQPKLIGGLTNTFSYRNFDLSIFFNFSWGNKVLNFSKASFVNMGGDIQSQQSTEALRRWQKPGDVTDVPRYELNSTINNLHSNRLLEDASYVRLKNLSIGYRLPQKIINRFAMDNVRVYLSATNLLTFTKYSGSDPEVSTLDGSTSAQGIDFFTLPQVRTIAVGINLTLK